MKSEATGSMTVSQGYITLPTDFIDCKDIRITGAYACRLRRGDERYVQDRYQYDQFDQRISQIPEWFYISGTKIIFDQPPDRVYPYLLPYYAKPADLAGGNLTNFLTDFHPRFLRTACMLIACEFEKEVGQGQFDRTYWQSQYDKQFMEIQIKSDVVDAAREIGAEYA